ncbi:30S ribosomal protein S12 methylthiotransferase RimO [Feifania hominis]|uniref:Ribosomal protein uS12 methylthiotransferase RimO n=1 Tax=Feifania hominis TaxID=2763660 RepID=A0A926HUK8_9FIRM|nr:30S ribosomal protein S12 methylthiotransferase RimO [Feifania hominis]MBC8537019.1 30S ribosomal protein S12 methylthiotransferase RimO [Feifania hominis]
MNPIRVTMISLGCSKNQVDGEVMLGRLAQSDGEFVLVSEPEQADVVIVNTCGFIESAKAEAIENILDMAQLKVNGVIRGIVVTGCLAERYREQLRAEMPEIDVVLGIGSNDDIARAVREASSGHGFEQFGPKTNLVGGGTRIRTTPWYTAYLKIAEGCDNRCAFCAIPSIRGPYRSRPMEELLDEARTLAADGVFELNVVAQDTTRYGEDLYGESRLPELLEGLAQIEGIRWVRTLYCYPDRISERLLRVIGAHESLVPYIDLPIQHASDPVLRRMNRHADAARTMQAIEDIRRLLPDAVLRTTLMVGFPGETEEDFELLLDFVKKVRFDRVGVFTFSMEEGTPAERFGDDVPEETKQSRRERLMLAQQRIVEQKNREKIGDVYETVVEGYLPEDGVYFGRTQYDAPEVDGTAFFHSERALCEGDLVPVEIEQVVDYDLYGHVVQA